MDSWGLWELNTIELRYIFTVLRNRNCQNDKVMASRWNFRESGCVALCQIHNTIAPTDHIQINYTKSIVAKVTRNVTSAVRFNKAHKSGSWKWMNPHKDWPRSVRLLPRLKQVCCLCSALGLLEHGGKEHNNLLLNGCTFSVRFLCVELNKPRVLKSTNDSATQLFDFTGISESCLAHKHNTIVDWQPWRVTIFQVLPVLLTIKENACLFTWLRVNV